MKFLYLLLLIFGVYYLISDTSLNINSDNNKSELNKVDKVLKLSGIDKDEDEAINKRFISLSDTELSSLKKDLTSKKELDSVEKKMLEKIEHNEEFVKNANNTISSTKKYLMNIIFLLGLTTITIFFVKKLIGNRSN